MYCLLQFIQSWSSLVFGLILLCKQHFFISHLFLFLFENIQDALVAQASYVREIKETVPVPPKEDRPTTVKRPPPSRPVNVIISVKPQAKKAKISTDTEKCSSGNPPVKYDTSNEKDNSPKNTNGALGALVSYSDESDEDS